MDRARNVIFFLGDGMGINTLTAARIYAVGESGELTIDTLPESAFVKTYSNDAQVTDSAASMSAYMTGVKHEQRRDLDVAATPGAMAPAGPTAAARSRCRPMARPAVPTLLELAKARGLATGVVTTTSVTDATPAATYAHVCHRKLQNQHRRDAGAGRRRLQRGAGRAASTWCSAAARSTSRRRRSGGKRTDGRDLLAELQARGYRVRTIAAELRGAGAGEPACDRPVRAGRHEPTTPNATRQSEPSLAEMTAQGGRRC